MKLNDIPKKDPFQLPTDTHFEKLRGQVFEQLEEQPAKTISLWVRPQVRAFAASIILLLVAMVGLYVFTDIPNQQLESSALTASNIDLSKIPTEELTNFLLDEDVSETELMAFLPTETQVAVFDNTQLDLEDFESDDIDLLLEEYY